MDDLLRWVDAVVDRQESKLKLLKEVQETMKTRATDIGGMFERYAKRNVARMTRELQTDSDVVDFNATVQLTTDEEAYEAMVVILGTTTELYLKSHQIATEIQEQFHATLLRIMNRVYKSQQR